MGLRKKIEKPKATIQSQDTGSFIRPTVQSKLKMGSSGAQQVRLVYSQGNLVRRFLGSLIGVSCAHFIKFCSKMETNQKSNLSNLGPKWKKSQGESPAFLSNLGSKWKKIKSQAFL